MKLPSMLCQRLFPVKKGTDLPMFLVHGIGGTALLFPSLAKFLPASRSIYALQAKGLDGEDPVEDRIEDIAATYITAIKSIQKEGPYQIAGYSHGSHIAYEMARQLEQDGHIVSFLGVLDHAAPTIDPEQVFHQAKNSETKKSFKRYASRFVEMAKKGDALKIKSAIKRRLKAHTNAGKYDSVDDIIDMEGWPEPIQKVARVHFEASRHYIPKPYNGSIDLFLTPNSVGNPEGWNALALGGVQVHNIPGSHETIFYEPHVQTFCEALDPLLLQSTLEQSTNATPH